MRRIAQETDQAKDVDTLIADLYHTPLRHLDGQSHLGCGPLQLWSRCVR